LVCRCELPALDWLTPKDFPMFNLTDAERVLPRARRRAISSSRRTKIKKKVPFGRVFVRDIETGETPQDDRIVYMHTTKGLMDRRTTFPLMTSLISVA